MKNTRKWLLGLVVLLACVSVGLCVTYRKIITVPFTTSGSYTVPTTAEYGGVLHFDMTFTGAAASNTLQLTMIRSNVTHNLLTYTATYKTLVWYLPSSYLIQTGDRFQWVNSVSGPAVMTIGVDF